MFLRFAFLTLIAFYPFASLKALTLLETLEEEGFSQQIFEEDPLGYEGHLKSLQKEQFIETLKTDHYSHIQSVLEIGLNAGHSCEFFLQTIPNLNYFASFDINQYPVTKVAAEYLSRTYPKTFHFFEGDSKVTVPEYHFYHPSQTFDLIYIDGDHCFMGAIADILNCYFLSHQNTYVWIDDCGMFNVARAIALLERHKVLKVIHSHKSGFIPETNKYERCWIEAQYVKGKEEVVKSLQEKLGL